MAPTELDCKNSIVEFCKNNKRMICAEFDPPLDNKAFSQCLSVENWNSDMDRVKSGEMDLSDLDSTVPEEMLYDCEPFDDQLRGYVSVAGDKVMGYVQGE